MSNPKNQITPIVMKKAHSHYLGGTRVETEDGEVFEYFVDKCHLSEKRAMKYAEKLVQDAVVALAGLGKTIVLNDINDPSIEYFRVEPK